MSSAIDQRMLAWFGGNRIAAGELELRRRLAVLERTGGLASAAVRTEFGQRIDDLESGIESDTILRKHPSLSGGPNLVFNAGYLNAFVSGTGPHYLLASTGLSAVAGGSILVSSCRFIGQMGITGSYLFAIVDTTGSVTLAIQWMAVGWA